MSKTVNRVVFYSENYRFAYIEAAIHSAYSFFSDEQQIETVQRICRGGW